MNGYPKLHHGINGSWVLVLGPTDWRVTSKADLLRFRNEINRVLGLRKPYNQKDNIPDLPEGEKEVAAPLEIEVLK